MKRLIALLSALLLAVALMGCAAKITGTPSQVVQECQEVPANQNPTVQVTGYVSFKSGDDCLFLRDSRSSSGGVLIQCMMQSDVPTVSAGDRVTVEGRALVISDDGLSLTDCSLIGV